MKKIFSFLFVGALLSFGVQAQDAAKNFRFGLRVDPTISWMKPDNTKKFANAGASMGFGWGLHLEFKLSEVASFYSAFTMQYDKGRLDYRPDVSTADSVFYQVNADDEIVEWQSSSINGGTSNNQVLMLDSRKFNASYVNMSFGLKMKTKEIGYLTYFGQFGANLGIRVKCKGDDEVQVVNLANNPFTYTAADKDDLDITSEIQMIRFGLSIGGGAEYNISGSTSLLFGISYNHGVTNSLKGESDYLRTLKDGSADLQTFDQKATARNIMLTIGILF